MIARCLDNDPERRFADAAELLKAVENCEAGDPLPALEPGRGRGGRDEEEEEVEAPKAEADPEVEKRFRDVRKLLATRAYDQIIDRLDVYRPAEWTTVDLIAARTLRALGQAYLGRGDLQSARECLEQLRDAQREQSVLTKADFAAALSDLFKVYRGLGQMELAKACQEEARKLL